MLTLEFEINKGGEIAHMIRIQFTPKEIEQLRYERFYHPHPVVQRKMEALLLKSHGLPHHQIRDILDICENTLIRYLLEYQQGSLSALKQLRFVTIQVSL